MMLSSMKICALLLWGVCMLFPVESETSSATENTPTDITTNQQTTAYVSLLQPTALLPAKPTDATAHAEEAVLPTAKHENGVRNTTNSSDSRQLGLTTAISSSKPLAPTEKVTTKDVVPVKTTAATVQTFTAGVTSTGQPQSVSQTITARREEEPFAAVTTASGEATSSTVPITASSKEQMSSSKTTGNAQTFTEVTSTGSGQQPSTAMTTATSEVQPPYRTTTTEAVNQTTDHLLHTSTSSFTDMTAPATGSATSAASHVSTQHSTSITEFRSEVPSTTSLDNSTQSASTISGPTASVSTSGAVKSTSSELSSPSYSVPATTNFNSTSSRPVFTSTDNANTTTANSTSAAGAFVPHVPGSTTSSTPSTTKAPCEPSKDYTSSEVLPCSTRGVAKQCLIIIAVLAMVATIFIVSTIVLCVRLSGRKYKVRKPQQDTEMMCISSLLPDRSHTYTRQRNLVSNGVLVFPPGGDSDEEGGDNLTLSSFLPENDRYV